METWMIIAIIVLVVLVAFALFAWTRSKQRSGTVKASRGPGTGERK